MLFIIWGSVVALPLLGMTVGAVAGGLTPRVSAGLGAVIGLVSGALGIGSTIFVAWVFLEQGYGLPSPKVRIVLAIVPPAVGLVAPIVLLQLIRMQRGRGN